MAKKDYYQIGEVSKICHIPIRTLHYYDEINLLKPDKVDEESQYRYYCHNQLQMINFIKFYKEAGFSLEEIKQLIVRENVTFNQRKLKEKCDEIDGEIARLMILKKKLKYMNWDIYNKPLESVVEFKEIPLCYVAYSRYKGGATPDEFILRYLKLNQIVEENHLHMSGPLMAIYYDDYRSFDYENADIEVCAPIAPIGEKLDCVRVWGGFKAAVALHYGSYDQMPNTYTKIFEAMEKEGYHYSGKAIENYIINCVTTADEENYVTQLIIPL